MIPDRLPPDTPPGEVDLHSALLREGQSVHVIWQYHWLEDLGRHYRGEIDFIVCVPSRGFLVIEVKSHPRIEIRNGVWHGGARPSSMHEIQNPVQQAEKGRGHLRRQFEAWGELEVPVHTAVFFPRAKVDLAADLPAGLLPSQVGDSDDLAKLTEWLKSALPPMADTRQITTLLQRLKNRRGQAWFAGEAFSYLLREAEKQIAIVDDKQRFAMDYIYRNNTAWISGCAGSGKTVCLLHMAERAGNDGLRTLVVTPKKPLGQMLRASLSDHPNIVAGDVDTVSSELVELATPSSATERLDEAWRRVVAGSLEPFDALFVDEAQDLKEDDWEYLRGLLRPEGSRCYVFSDNNQTTSSNKTLALVERDLGHGYTNSLDQNYRNSKEISEDVVKHYRGPGFVPTGRAIVKPDYIKVSSIDEEIRELRSTLNKLLIGSRDSKPYLRPTDVVLLTPDEDSITALLAGDLGPHSINRWPGTGNDVRWALTQEFGGMEADCVILVGLSNVASCATAQESEGLLYVAKSRAKTRLIVLQPQSRHS